MRMRLCMCTGVLFLTGMAGVAVADFTINFESPTYTLGNIAAQDGWSIVAGATATAEIIEYPPASGNHVLKLETTTGGAGYRVRCRRSTGVAAVTGPTFVTLAYDLYYVSATGNVGPILRPRLGDSADPGFFAWYAMHYDGGGSTGSQCASQYFMARLPNGTQGNFELNGNPGGIGQIVDGGTSHRLEWHWFSSGVDLGGSHLMYKIGDGTQYNTRNAYLNDWSPGADVTPDIIELALLHNNGNPGMTTWYIDNLSVTSQHDVAAAPVAEANGPYIATQCPTPVTAAGSTNPATYQWCTPINAQTLLLETASLTDFVTFPNATGAQDVVMNVTDARGVYNSDTTTVTTVGACCQGDGTCIQVSDTQCAAAAGEFFGFCTSCADVEPCAQPEACCIGTDCILLAPVSCSLQGGASPGQATCTPNPCIPLPCCFADGTCQEIPAANCLAQNGTIRTDLPSCTPNLCPPPSAACCVGCVCAFLTEADCTAVGGTWQGFGSNCAANPCLASLGVVAYIAMDEQINTDAITDGGGFGTNSVDGWTLVTLPGGGWWGGPSLWFDRAYGNPIDVSAATIEWTARYFQGLGNSSPYGDCPIRAHIYDMSGLQCQSDWVWRATTINPLSQFPHWMAVQYAATDPAHCIEGNGPDLTQIRRMWWEVTDWAGVGADFYEIKDVLVYTGTAPTGACCLPDGTCIADQTMLDCVNGNANAGMWKGPCTTCEGANCTPLPGACCLPDGSCEFVTAAQCATDQGLFRNWDVPCEMAACPLPGACCFGPGNCVDGVTIWACQAQRGTFMGETSTCDILACDPLQACCLPDGTCVEIAPQGCTDLGGAVRAEATCAETGPCTRACCIPGAACQDLSVSACAALGGVSGPDQSSCADGFCPTNDTCADAILIAVPSVTLGDTTYATLTDAAPAGCAAPPDAPDVWYTLVGDGGNITISMCASPQPRDYEIGILTGTCGNLTCVAYNDDFCGGGGPSQVTFPSVCGTTYLVRVFGWIYPPPQVGQFQLDVTTDAATPCTGACCFKSCCRENYTEADCVAANGVFQGVGTTCAAPTCTVCRGDCDCTGFVNFNDINYFVTALAGGVNGETAWRNYYTTKKGEPPCCPYANVDANGDTFVNFNDINPFVNLLLTQPICP